MVADLGRVLKLEAPIIVLLGERQMTVKQVIALAPGAIIELPKGIEEELEMRVNNKAIGTGVAVKVGENFGIKLTYLGDVLSRIAALGPGRGSAKTTEATGETLSAALASEV